MKKVLFLGVLMVIFLGSTASATLWQIDATSTNSKWGDFTAVFNDADDDNVIDVGPLNSAPPDSIFSFSGVQFNDSTFGLIELETLTLNPGLSIDPLTVLPGIPFGNFINTWNFRGTSFDPTYAVGTSSPVWTYTASQAQASVPEPTTLLLLGTGLVGLAGARRKLKK